MPERLPAAATVNSLSSSKPETILDNLSFCGFPISTTAEGKKLILTCSDSRHLSMETQCHLGHSAGTLLLGPVLTPRVVLRLYFT